MASVRFYSDFVVKLKKERILVVDNNGEHLITDDDTKNKDVVGQLWENQRIIYQMDILILGNGFDLAHGLKTTYMDFLNYCVEKNSKRLIRMVNYGTTFIDNIWLRHFITTNNNYGKNWIDLEEEIYRVILSLNKNIKDLSGGDVKIVFPLIFTIQKDILNFDFEQIIDCLKTCNDRIQTDDRKYAIIETNDFSHLHFYIDNYQGFVNFIYDQLRDFIKLFEKYLSEVVMFQCTSESEYQLSLLKGSKPNIMNFLFVLNFNYTSTLTNLYERAMNSRQKQSIQNFYIHGKIDSNNIVLGTQFYDNNKTNISLEFNVFRKHNQRHKYNTIEEYQSLLHIIKNSNDNTKRIFHVVGHSLDKSDSIILKHIFLANKNSVINVYYHNEENQEKLINNITEIIGEEEVMEKVRFIYQHDPKSGILIPVEVPILVEN